MLKLRKILLCNYIFYCFTIIILFITIIRLSLPKSSIYQEGYQTFTGIITNITIKENKLTIYLKNKETIIASYYLKTQEAPQLNLGDKITVTGQFKKPSPNTTDYLFNYEKYLQRKNIFYLVKIHSLTKRRSNINPYYFLKQKIINHIACNPYLATFLLGDKSYLNSVVKRSYQENGISHLFAISGMHITLLTSIINKLLKKLKLQEQQIFKITSIILLLYLALTGISPSILRGILFYFLFSLNKIYYFYIKPQNIFLIILGLTLIVNPNYLYDVGFLYSYLISFSLLLTSDILQSKNYLLGLFKVSLISFVVSIPITIYNFYQLNLLGILYNLFFVPTISLIIFPLSLLTVFIKPLLPVFNLLTSIMEKISLLLSKISLGKIIFQRIPLNFYLLYFFLILAYLILKQQKILVIYFFLLLIHFLIPYFSTSTYLKVIDVGQGDSILLKSHHKTVLVDTGGVSSFKDSSYDGQIFYNTLNPLFHSLGIKKIDYLILTHGDKDHLGEAKTLLENFSVEKVIINSNRLNYYEKKLINQKTIIGKPGLTFKLNDLDFIQLNENLIDENDSSQIYLVKYKNIKILLTGDASIKSEETLLENYDLGNVDILKVGHHGSNTSTSEKLLQELKPKIALISSGRENKFGHPHQEIITRLKEHHLRIYNTKEFGTITLNLTTKKISTTLKYK